MEWILNSPQDISTIRDEFVLEGCRVCLHGNQLTVDVEQDDQDELFPTSHEVATRYAAALRKHAPWFLFTLMTLEELASLPAEAITMYGSSGAERKRLNEAVRRARCELLASANPYLVQCYDYLQDAREADDDNYLFPLYKLVETLENVLGGETKMIKALKVERKPVKFLIRLANDPIRDARHARRVRDVVQRPSTEERAVAMNCSYQILHSYERYLSSSS